MPTMIPAGELVKGMTAKVRGHGRRNRTTVLITKTQNGRLLSDVTIFGDNANAAYGQRSQVCRFVPRDELCEVVADDRCVAPHPVIPSPACSRCREWGHR